MEYETENHGAISSKMPVVDGDGEILGDLVFHARNIRKERTAEHAVVAIRWNRNQLEFDNFNVTRNEERRKLATNAWKLLPIEAKAVFPVEYMKAELDLFCEGLWEAHIGRVEIEELSPSPSRKPQRMLGPYTIKGGGTIIFGDPGAGKSWLLMLIAQTINSGSTAIWPVVNPHKVLFINLERDRSGFEDRLGQINLALGLREQHSLSVLNKRGSTLREVEDAARKYVIENEVEVIVLDSISRAGAGDFNNSAVANEIMDTLSRICPTWLAIAHQAKAAPGGGKGTTLGSVMFGGAADLTLALTSQKQPNTIILELDVGKSNIKISGRQDSYVLDMTGDKLVSVRKVSEPEWKMDGG